MKEKEKKSPSSPDGIVFSLHPSHKNFRDITGHVFNHLTVLGYSGLSKGGKTKTHMWWVRCECGTVKVVASGNMVSGGVKSCGCKRFHYNSVAHKTHGMSKSREFTSWTGMLSRCGNPNDPFFSCYGGRGIRVCDRWKSFQYFFSDMGHRPTGKTLDRINVDGDYEPSNCRWATFVEQGRNTRVNHMVTFNGQSLCLKEWADRIGIGYSTLLERIKRGWSHSEALTAEVGHRTRKPSQRASTAQHE